MKRLANERKYVEDMIKNKTLNVGRPGKDLNSLIKYLYECNPLLTKQELIQLVNDTLLDLIQNEKAIKRWQVSIKEYVDNFMSYADKFKGLSHIESIHITKNELENIKALKNKKLEYVAFALLVYLKVQNEITGRVENVYCPSGEEHVKMIKKITGLNITITKTALAMKQLQDLGYTENGMGGAVVCKLNYADYAGERVIEIRDFDEKNLHLYYEYYLNKVKYKHCKECNKIFTIDTKTCAPQYCTNCKQQKELEKFIKYNKKTRQ